MRLWFVCLLLLPGLSVQAQDRIWLNNGSVISNIKVKPTDFKSFAVTYERNGRSKLVPTLDVTRIDLGDSTVYNEVAYRSRKLEHIKNYGRPNQAEMSIFFGYSFLGSKKDFETVFARNKLANYRSTGLFGSYKNSGKSVVYDNGGIGVKLDMLMSKNSVFFIQYYYHKYGIRAEGAFTQSYYSRPSVQADFTYNQHSFVLGVGRILNLPVVHSKATLKAGLLIIGTQTTNANNGMDNLKMEMTETGTFGLFGEAGVAVWSSEKLAVNAFCQYYYTNSSRLHSDFSRAYDESSAEPSYRWQDGYVKNHRLLSGVSVGFRF